MLPRRSITRDRPASLQLVHRVAPALLIAALGLTATFVAGRTVREMERRELEMEFSSLANERCTWVRKAMADHLNDLTSVRGFLDASAHVEAEPFETFVLTILRRQPAIQAIEWVPRVDAEHRASWEEALRAEADAGFSITELAPDGRLIPATADRETYFPVQYVMPRESNQRALGFDLYSTPIRRDALERARDTGLPTATERVTLIQENERQHSFLIFLPKYAPNTAIETRAQRRAALEGFVLGVFRAHDTIEAMLGLFRPVGVQLDLHQVNRGGVDHMATYRPPGPQTTARDDLPDPVDVPFSFAGRDWLITASATPALADGRRSAFPWITAGSLLLTTLMTCYFVMLAGRAAAVQRLVVQRTTELAGRDADLGPKQAYPQAVARA
jgi:CHASE1-domain containing sensor protein